jgi:predicted peptidase
MIDRLSVRLSERIHQTYDPDYAPSKAVIGSTLLNEDASNLVVVFPPWHSNAFFDSLLSQRLAKKGSAVLSNTFHGQILEPNTERVRDSFKTIGRIVSQEVGAVVRSHDYKTVRLLGLSLGNVSLALVAERFPDFDEATLVVAGSNLAMSMWHGDRTQSIKEGFEAQGIGARQVDVAWTDLAPKSHTEAFRDRPVGLYVSTSDRIIPSAYQFEMVEELNNHGALTAVNYSSLGHIMTVLSLVTA